MTDATRKFRNYLKNKIIFKERALNNVYLEFEKTNLEKFERPKHEINRSLLIAKLYALLICLKKLSIKKKFDLDHKESIAKIDEIKRLLSYFEKENDFFDDFKLLNNYLSAYTLPDIEKGEVVAHFINMNIKHYENEMQKKSKRKDKNLEMEINKMRKIISTDGKIIVNLSTTIILTSEDTLEIFTKYANEESACLLVKSGLLMSSEKLEKDKKRNREKEQSDKARTKTTEKFEREQRKQKAAKTIEANAKKELKKYLLDDQPIKYISDEELDHVMELLRQLNYNFNQRNNIKRMILSYNQKCLEREKQELFNTAKTKFLAPSEISLLNAVEAIFDNPDSIKNPVYIDIENMYTEIKSRLMFLMNNIEDETLVVSDEVGYIMLCIEELTALISNYRNSDYKLNRTPNSN